MRNRGIAEHAHDVEQGVGIAKRGDVEQRLSSGARPGDAGNICEFDRCRDAFSRVEERCQPVEALVGDPRDADVGVGLSLAGRLADARQELKEGGLTLGNPIRPARSIDGKGWGSGQSQKFSS
jgi:hypothetical protein